MHKPTYRWKTLLRRSQFIGIEGSEVYLERMPAIFSCTIPGLFHRIAHAGAEKVFRVYFPSTVVENIKKERSNVGCGLLSNCGIM